MRRGLLLVAASVVVASVTAVSAVAAFAQDECVSQGVGNIVTEGCVSTPGGVSAEDGHVSGDVGAIDVEGDVSTEGGSVSGNVGAIGAEGDVSTDPAGGGVTGEAGAIDVQGGTDRGECIDAGSVELVEDCDR